MTSVVRVESTTAASDEHASLWSLGRTSWVIQAGAGLVVLQLLFRAWVVYGAWFRGDDFAFISRMLNDGLSPGVAARGHGGHLMPGGMYLSWLSNAISPYDWRITATCLLIMQATAGLGLLRLLVVMFGVRPGILAPLAIYLFTVFTVPVSVWWAAGVNQLPMQVALFFGTASAVRYLRHLRTRDLVLAAVWVGFGLLFFEKSLLVMGAYGVIAMSYFATGSLLDRLRHVWSGYRTAVVVFAAVGVTYIVLYAQTAQNFGPSQANQTPIAPVLGNMVLRAWLTAVFGGPLKWTYAPEGGGLANPAGWALLLSGVLLVLLVREVRRTRENGVRALALPAFFLLANVVLVTAGRASFVGAGIALEYRYQAELGAVTALALGLALMPILGATEQVRQIRPSALFDQHDRAVLACVAVCALGVISSIQYAVHWHHGDFAKKYFQAMTGDVRAAKEPIDMVDGAVPNDILWALGYPTNTHSHLLRQFPEARFVHVATDQLHMVGPDGHVKPAGIPPVRTAVAVPGKTCDYRVASTDRDIPLNGPVAYGGWWVRVGYVATARSPVKVSAGGRTSSTTVKPGLHSLYFAAGDKPFDSITISGLEGRAVLCTDDVTVGRPEPAKMGQP